MTTILNNNDNNNSTAITLQRELARILQEITDNQSTPDVKIFKQLLDNLRENSDDESSTNEHMSIFVRLLREKKAWADGLCVFLLNLIAQYRQTAVYTDMGILSDESFLSQFHLLLGQRILPPVLDDKELITLFHLLFNKKKS